jgi:hypothetical protein
LQLSIGIAAFFALEWTDHAIIDQMSVSLGTRRRWFAQGAAAWYRTQIVLGVPGSEARTDLYACPLCLEINHEERRAQFRVFVEAALMDGSLTVEHVPSESLGGRPLVLTCRVCNSTAGTGLDAHARKRENPRDAFLGRVTTKISMTVGGHRLAGSFTFEDGAYHFMATRKANAHRPDAEAGVRRMLAGPEDSDRDITLSFDHDQFDGDRARVSWLRAGYLTLFAVTGYRVIVWHKMEIVRRQIREPKVAHIPAFLIDTQHDEDWSDRVFVRFTTPAWQRCWGIKIGHFVVCLPLPGDVGLYDRLAAARREGTQGVAGHAEAWEWPTRPSFGLPFPDSAA